jgi:hypothetical protein
MKLRLTWFLVAGLLAIAVPQPARSQDPGRDRVQAAIELTDRRIEQAEALITGTDNARARAEYDQAVSIQGEAKRAFGNSQLAFASRLTLEARRHAERAIATVRGPNPDGVLAQLERTRDLLDRARDRVEECEIVRARAMMKSALDMQARAESAAQESRFLAALQLTVGARERAHRALRLCDAEEDLQASAERALRRTDDVLRAAQDAVADGTSDAASAAFRRAADVQDRAWREYRAERWEASLRLTLSARAFGHRALRLAGGAP